MICSIKAVFVANQAMSHNHVAFCLKPSSASNILLLASKDVSLSVWPLLSTICITAGERSSLSVATSLSLSLYVCSLLPSI